MSTQQSQALAYSRLREALDRREALKAERPVKFFLNYGVFNFGIMVRIDVAHYPVNGVKTISWEEIETSILDPIKAAEDYLFNSCEKEAANATHR